MCTTVYSRHSTVLHCTGLVSCCSYTLFTCELYKTLWPRRVLEASFDLDARSVRFSRPKHCTVHTYWMTQHFQHPWRLNRAPPPIDIMKCLYKLERRDSRPRSLREKRRALPHIFAFLSVYCTLGRPLWKTMWWQWDSNAWGYNLCMRVYIKIYKCLNIYDTECMCSVLQFA